MLSLTGLELYNSIFNITEENNKFKLYKFPDEKSGGISYIKVKDEIQNDLDVSDITIIDLEDNIIVPIIIEEHRNQETMRMKADKYVDILGFCIISLFQDFESFLRTEVDLVEDDIKLVLDEYNSSFITYELEPGIYTFKDILGALLKVLQPESPGPSSVSDIEFDDITRKSELVARSGSISIRFDEKSFLVVF